MRLRNSSIDHPRNSRSAFDNGLGALLSEHYFHRLITPSASHVLNPWGPDYTRSDFSAMSSSPGLASSIIARSSVQATENALSPNRERTVTTERS